MKPEDKEYINQLITEDILIKKRSKEIQSKYNFKIPDYVLSEWIYAEAHNNFNNVIALLKLAKVSNRISVDNVNELKNYIKEYYV